MGNNSTAPKHTTPLSISYLDYDYVVLAFSGGKDSMACLLHLLDSGCPKEKIELWHHLIDGKEGSKMMDWPITEDYCRKVAKAFGLPIYFSWRVGGFEREMNRNNQATAPVKFERPTGDNLIECGLAGGKGPKNTRRMFPQVSADLRVRWCSAYLKIEVCVSAINNQDRFRGKRILVVSGERAEESTARANYKTIQVHKTTTKTRTTIQWRPVHKWTEAQVWEIMKKYNVKPHPAYLLGWGRLSCMKCIFGSASQWASAAAIDGSGVTMIEQYEMEFGKTIHRTKTVSQLVSEGTIYEPVLDPAHQGDVDQSQSETYTDKIFTDNWTLPAGAFGDSQGPS